MRKRVLRLEEQQPTDAELLQQERCEKFAPQAADQIRAAANCLFSVLPHAELSRLVGDWYKACSQAMLRGNYSPIDQWVRSQSQVAAAQGFAPEDFIQLLLICRRSAIELESWNEDILCSVDEVIHEVFGAVRPQLTWKIPDVLAQEVGVACIADAIKTNVEEMADERKGERRRFVRNRLRFPIRIVSSGDRRVGEIAQTQSISRGGLYFISGKTYDEKHILKINFPYWNEPGGINREYAAKIVRLDRFVDDTWGVGVDFLESLNRKRH